MHIMFHYRTSFYRFTLHSHRRYSDGLRARQPRFDSRQGQEILYSPQRPDRNWDPPYPIGTRALSPKVKRQEREADQSLPSYAEVKHGGAIPLLPQTSSWRDA
jgi:hypothetical protein